MLYLSNKQDSQKKTRSLVHTLQPLSTSMPMTCGSGDVSVGHKRKFVPVKKKQHEAKIHNVVTCICDQSYRSYLLVLLEESITSICDSFESEGVSQQTQVLLDTIHKCSHCTLCVVFFMLLNVDATLKNKIISLDSNVNLPKITRFLLDLRRVLAVRFFTDETFTPSNFVDECLDCYMLS